MQPLRVVGLLATLLSAMALAQPSSVISQPLVVKSGVPGGMSQADAASQAKIREN